MRLLIFIVAFLFAAGKAYAVPVIQTSPPPNISGYVCQCSFDACSCTQGEITISVDLKKREAEWENYADRHCFFGTCEDICGSYCVDNIGVVTSIKVPFMTIDMARSAVRRVDYIRRKSMSFTERITSSLIDRFGDNDIVKSLVSFLRGGEEKQSGTGMTAEDVYTITKEKAFSKSESESENIRNDLTVYLLTQIARDFFGLKQNEVPKISQYAGVISVLSDLNREGRLVDFISSYLYLKSRNKPVDFYSLYSSLMGQKKFDFSNMTLKVDDAQKKIYFVVPHGTSFYEAALLSADIWRYYIFSREKGNTTFQAKCLNMLILPESFENVRKCLAALKEDVPEDLRKKYSEYTIRPVSSDEFGKIQGQTVPVKLSDVDVSKVVQEVKKVPVEDLKEEKRKKGILSKILSFVWSVFVLAVKLVLALLVVYICYRIYMRVTGKSKSEGI